MNAYSRQALSWLMLCLILAGLTAYGLALRDQVRALDERIESHYALVSSLGDTLYRLSANLGYAGFINNFNHYIVRRHPRFLDAARRQLDAASQALEDYRVLAVRDDELGALDAIRQTLALHREMLELASSKASHELSAEELGAMYLDAPVVGGPAQTRLGQLLVLVSGTREAYEKALPMLKNLGETVMYVGDVPTATVLKLAINSMFFISAQTISEAMALASAWGVDPEVLREAASKTWLKTLFDKYYDRMMSKERPPSFTVRLAAKDLAYAQQAGYMRGTPLPLVSTALQTYLEASRRGYDSSDYSRIAWHVMGGEPGRSS